MQDIETQITNGICWIWLNRPEVSNAARVQTVREMCRVLDDAEANPEVHALVLSHRHKHFLAGADFGLLQELKTFTPVQVRDEIYAHFQGAAKRLHLFSKPTVAALRGAAITVGCELTLACDFRLVTRSAVFHENWLRMGLLAPLGGMKALPALVGYGRAKEMMLLSKPVEGTEAVEIGLATRLLEEEGFEDVVHDFALELAAKPRLAYAAAKESLRRGLETSFDEGWALNLLAQNVLIGSSDYREGLSAALERRQPKFIGA
ncbi:hypothetical protein ACFB49_26160 [Sphingomonas sp. DBB INV C78]|uniref:enoyl-CoA hydratase/isomerase family protein n=1 Tax=Sphingomonas sp. DBB INV C78 TaxID=3349434 RepID=UPI0036D2B1DE